MFGFLLFFFYHSGFGYLPFPVEKNPACLERIGQCRLLCAWLEWIGQPARIWQWHFAACGLKEELRDGKCGPQLHECECVMVLLCVAVNRFLLMLLVLMMLLLLYNRLLRPAVPRRITGRHIHTHTHTHTWRRHTDMDHECKCIHTCTRTVTRRYIYTCSIKFQTHLNWTQNHTLRQKDSKRKANPK